MLIGVLIVLTYAIWKIGMLLVQQLKVIASILKDESDEDDGDGLSLDAAIKDSGGSERTRIKDNLLNFPNRNSS